MYTEILRSLCGEFAATPVSGDINRCSLVLSLSQWIEEGISKGIDCAAQAADGKCEDCNGRCVQLAKIWHASLLTCIRDRKAAARRLNSVAIPSGISDHDGLSVVLLVSRAKFDLAWGDLDTAAAKAELGVELAEWAGVGALLPSLHIVLAMVAVRRSNVSEALDYAHLLGSDALLGRTDYAQGQCAWAAAQAMEADKGPAGAAHLVERLITDNRFNRDLLIAQPAAAAWLARAARDLGDERLAAVCAERAGELAREAPEFQSLQAAALHAEGVAENCARKLQAAGDLHLDRWASASASEDQAKVWAAREADGDRALELLKQAADGYEEAGAARDLARVASKLRDLGGRAGRVMRSLRRDGRTMAFLTDTEFAVANLVSQGMTNAQVGGQLYISTHTVAFHLKKIFRKMEVSSRVELATAWVSLTVG